MYAAGYGIRPLASRRHTAGVAALARLAAVIGLSAAVGVGLAVVAHGGSAPADTTVVVQPGDTLWAIAAARYPADDVRIRVDDIERANGLHGPVIVAGQTLHLP
ncbi:MAG TPA: LysM peptidoglycan-binding domain-containing protein, partial [Candidatus Sulfotelmatobacter sp.]|nr:LysM peptidoglycan-binding domain-containing protein [Candidatus Sulfotelmatobacter sp.]